MCYFWKLNGKAGVELLSCNHPVTKDHGFDHLHSGCTLIRSSLLGKSKPQAFGVFFLIMMLANMLLSECQLSRQLPKSICYSIWSLPDQALRLFPCSFSRQHKFMTLLLKVHHSSNTGFRNNRNIYHVYNNGELTFYWTLVAWLHRTSQDGCWD